jgi:hypothetical protein
MTPNLTVGTKSASLQSKLRSVLPNVTLVGFSAAVSLLLIEGARRFYVDFISAGGPFSRWEFRAVRPPPYQDADYSTPVFPSELPANHPQNPPGLDTAFRVGYPGLRNAVGKAQWAGVISFDSSMILAAGTIPKEVFLDFAHVNHVANEILARAMCADIRGEIG